MSKRALLCLLAPLALIACAAPEPLAEMGAPAPVEESPMVLVEPAPAPARDSALAQECSGDGIGGTGCPDL